MTKTGADRKDHICPGKSENESDRELKNVEERSKPNRQTQVVEVVHHQGELQKCFYGFIILYPSEKVLRVGGEHNETQGQHDVKVEGWQIIIF